MTTETNILIDALVATVLKEQSLPQLLAHLSTRLVIEGNADMSKANRSYIHAWATDNNLGCGQEPLMDFLERYANQGDTETILTEMDQECVAEYAADHNLVDIAHMDETEVVEFVVNNELVSLDNWSIDEAVRWYGAEDILYDIDNNKIEAYCSENEIFPQQDHREAHQMLGAIEEAVQTIRDHLQE